MEPSDIDKIIKEKLEEGNDLHKHEIDSAKPFIWSAIQNQIVQKRSLSWYHLAAAVVLLMIGFSFVIYNIQKMHNNEIDQLSEKVDQLERKYTSQMELLHMKNTQLDSLGNKLRNVELRFTGLQQQKPVTQEAKVIYRTDTVYIKQFERKTNTTKPEGSEEMEINKAKDEPIFVERSKEDEVETNYAIYSNYLDQKDIEESETIKLKFGSFATKNN